MPHAPQLRASVAEFTQVATPVTGHTMFEAPPGHTQRLALHVWPTAVHAPPHVPQLATSSASETSQPSPVSRLQSAKFVSHT